MRQQLAGKPCRVECLSGYVSTTLKRVYIDDFLEFGINILEKAREITF